MIDFGRHITGFDAMRYPVDLDRYLRGHQPEITVLFSATQPPHPLAISYFTPLNCSKGAPAGIQRGS
jgi:hypothetical protein